MGYHFAPAPIHSLAEPVYILKHGIVSNRSGLFTKYFILNQSDLYFLIQWVKSNQFPLLDCKNIKFFILSTPDSQLDIPFIAKLELCFLGSLASVVIWNHVKLS